MTLHKTAFLFSGQGAQFPGMMHDVYAAVSGARRVFEVASKALDRDIAALCFEGTQEELNHTRNTQPCVLAADLAAYEGFLEAGVIPGAVAGFSLGEYAALVVAGVLDEVDAFRLVQLRANAMQAAVPEGKGAMAAIMKGSAEELEELCEQADGYVACANYNSPMQIVISGEIAAVDAVVAVCRERKIRAMRLPVSVPSHCALMTPAADALADALSSVDLRVPRLPLYMNTVARPVRDVTEIRESMIAQLTLPVLWYQTLIALWNAGFTSFAECGPGSTLTGFVKKTLPDANLQNNSGAI